MFSLINKINPFAQSNSIVSTKEATPTLVVYANASLVEEYENTCLLKEHGASFANFLTDKFQLDIENHKLKIIVKDASLCSLRLDGGYQDTQFINVKFSNVDLTDINQDNTSPSFLGCKFNNVILSTNILPNIELSDFINCTKQISPLIPFLGHAKYESLSCADFASSTPSNVLTDVVDNDQLTIIQKVEPGLFDRVANGITNYGLSSVANSLTDQVHSFQPGFEKFTDRLTHKAYYATALSTFCGTNFIANSAVASFAIPGLVASLPGAAITAASVGYCLANGYFSHKIASSVSTVVKHSTDSLNKFLFGSSSSVAYETNFDRFKELSKEEQQKIANKLLSYVDRENQHILLEAESDNEGYTVITTLPAATEQNDTVSLEYIAIEPACIDSPEEIFYYDEFSASIIIDDYVL